jgi:hypothetical protein
MNIEESNKELIIELEKRENYWNNTINKLSKRIKYELKDIVNLQSDTISQKQILTDEIKYISLELYKFRPIYKEMRKLKTEFYLTKYPIKLQGKEKLFLIEHDLSFYEQRLDIYDNHIDFLRITMNNIDTITYAIKNKITLYQLTELD